MREEILRMDRVTRIVDGVVRLNRFSLHLFKGEIMGLLCMNDQGKDDLVQLLQQNLPLHYGFVTFEEQLVNSYQKSSLSPNRVSVIDRRGRLIDDLSVADNIFVLRPGFKKYIINPRVLRGQLEQFTREMGVSLPLHAPVGTLSAYERCVVELLRAVVAGTRLVVVRDISNILPAGDLERFQALIRHCAKRGFTFLYICSHHEEAFPLCDRVCMMENGAIVLLLEKPFSNDEAIWRHSLDFSRPMFRTEQPTESQPVVRLKNVCTQSMDSLSFSVWPGECVAILDRSNTVLGDLMALMNRELVPEQGEIWVDGLPYKQGRPLASGQNLGFISADPVHSMIFPEMSALENLCLLTDSRLPQIWRDRGLQRSIQREYEAFLGNAIYEQDVRELSHRQRYDLVYYRMHLYHPAAVFCMQPFLGADMYLRHHIISLLDMLHERKTATILLSVNISDSLSVADRLLVLESGRLTREYARKDFHTLSPQEGYDPHRTK